MDSLQAIILALVQGVTEFLPISSSAHLILVPRFLGWTDQGLDDGLHAIQGHSVGDFLAAECPVVRAGTLLSAECPQGSGGTP